MTDDHATADAGTGALDFLAGRLARLLAERAAAGLHRAYTECAVSGPFLQGRLDLAAQRREGTSRKDRLHCRYEEFTADVPCNQVPKATAELVLRSPLLGEGVRAALRHALGALDGVQSVALGPEAFSAAAADRLAEAYRPLLDLCRLLADSLEPGGEAGSTPWPAFLINMERVFEQYVTRGVVDAVTGRGYSVRAQPLVTANRPSAGQPDIPMRPDVIIERYGSPVAVLDAKWKRPPGSLPATDDLYQVLAYAAALGVRRAVLVYPGRRDRVRTYELARSPVRVEVRTLRVVGPREALAASLRRLGRAAKSTD